MVIAFWISLRLSKLRTRLAIPYRIQGRRAGDIATCYASSEKAKEVLGWEAKKTLKEMVRDSWRWQTTNPNGYED